MGVNALPIIGSYYIRDAKLLEMTSYAFAGSNATSVNIYIDLYPILKNLIGPSYSMEERVSDYEIASGIINMIAHYRAFFWRKLRVQTKFFLVYSVNNSMTTTTYFPMYNSSYTSTIPFNKDKMDLIFRNISLVEKLSSYIDDCCLTIGRYEPCVIMHHIMETEQSPDPNIVITKDLVTMQVAAMHNSNTVIYRPKKYKGEDISYAIIPNNNGLYHHIAFDRGIKDIEFQSEISSELYSLILSMIGVKSRDMNSILSYSNAMKNLSKAILHNNNGYSYDIKYIYEEFDEKSMYALMNGNVHNRFKAIDMIYQYGLFLNSPDRLYYKGIQNLYDPVGFHAVCEEYFKECPIDTERL